MSQVTRFAVKSFLSNFGEFIEQTAFRKHRAAQARFTNTAKDGESPHDVTSQACLQIAGDLQEDGFQFNKSKTSCIKRTEDLFFEIHFQSDRNNVRGEHVGMWIHANVSSKRLKQWRKERSGNPKSGGGLAGGQIGNLLRKKGWMEWELAEASSRDQTVRDAVSTIREIALPYFAEFADSALLLKRIRSCSIEELHIGAAIEYTLCCGSPEQAQSVLAGFFEGKPHLLTEYWEAIYEFRQKGLPVFHQSHYAKAAAFATIAYGLAPIEKPQS